MRLLFDGPRFVAVDKPGGWLSVPSRWGAEDSRPCVGRHLERELGCRLWPVHRLDEEVTGVLLFARDAEAHAAANACFEARQVAKHYEAWTELPADGSRPAPGPHEWSATLLRGKKRAYESPHGKPSHTRAAQLGEVTVEGAPALAWTLEPLTGRPHQLRWELARHGCPVLGDALYGSTRRFLQSTIALRCVRLSFARALAQVTWLGLPEALEAPALAAWHATAAAEDGVTPT